MDREKVIRAVEDLLDALGEDGNREGLRDTPRRVADAYAELLSGEGRLRKSIYPARLSPIAGIRWLKAIFTFPRSASIT